MSWYTMYGTDEINERLKNSPSDIRQYLSEIIQNGFTVIPNSIPADILNEVDEAFGNFKAKIANDELPRVNGKYQRIVNLHSALPQFAKLFAKNDIALRMLDYLFGEESTLYTSLFYEIGSSQDLHRDTPYFWTSPGYRYFGVWVALEDVDTKNGCLQVVPRSNQLEEEDREKIGLEFYSKSADIPSADQRLWDRYQKLAQDRATANGLERLDVCVKRGDTIIWHPHTLHGGRIIEDIERSRKSFVMHVTPLNQAVYHHQGFFNVEANLATHHHKNHNVEQGRQYVNYNQISFGHSVNMDASIFK